MCNRDNMVRLKDKKKDVENGEVDEIKDDLRIGEFIMDYEEFVKRVCVIVKFFVSRKFIKWLYKIVKKGKCGVYLLWFDWDLVIKVWLGFFKIFF